MKKILLIHGWNYQNYTNSNRINAWANRSKFVEELSKHYIIDYMNLPGFCGTPEPKCKSWNLSDFANYIENYIKKQKVKPDYVLGYSFGGAVALRWKTLHKGKKPLILVAPALLRATSNKNIKVKHWPKKLNFIKKCIRDLYLIHIVKNPEMKYGTRFLRNTYQNIVREDLSKEIGILKESEYLLIFGERDKTVPPQLLIDHLENNKVIENIRIIKAGKHDIANTHTKELLEIIRGYIK